MKNMKNFAKPKIIFMGTSSFAAAILKALLAESYKIISVYTQSGDAEKTPVMEICEKNNLRIFEPKKFDEENIEKISVQDPDLIIVASYGKILPKAVLEIPKFGALNVHGSLLPKYRGPSPFQNAILDGENFTGVTVMLMDEGIDTGDILNQRKIPIESGETYEEFMLKSAPISGQLLIETIPEWIEGKIKRKKQDQAQATYCQMIERSDGKVNWSEDAKNIYNQFRAFTPWPGIFTFFEKNRHNLRVKLQKIEFSEKDADESKKIGEVFEKDNEIAVKTAKGAIIIKEIQLEGKAKVKIESFVNGCRDFIGSILK